VIGLHVTVPPKSQDGKPSPVMPLTNSTKNKNDTLAMDEITTENAELEFMSSKSDRDPYKIQINRLTLGHVGQNGSISFRAVMLNTKPPGEIRSTGQIGPWNEDDPGSTPVSGSYSFSDANLGVFEGIAGTLSSQGKFDGKVDHIQAEGAVDVPNFHVSGSKHVVHLSNEFQALVDGTNGDTFLQDVKSHFERTMAVTSGGVTGQPGQHGKEVALRMSVKDGRIDDLLRLVTDEKQPSMTGSVSFQAKINLPPGPAGFLEKLGLEGGFGLGSERFTDASVQAPINKLTESAQGETNKQQAADPATVLSSLKGHVSVKNGIATLSNVSFSAPGTLAEVRGTYNLQNNAVNFQGILHTNGKLADTTSGFKAVVLKAVGPFLKKKTVTVVPFTITGTSMQPNFSLDLTAKRTF
jgi:AsmA-like C-terminal region